MSIKQVCRSIGRGMAVGVLVVSGILLAGCHSSRPANNQFTDVSGATDDAKAAPAATAANAAALTQALNSAASAPAASSVAADPNVDVFQVGDFIVITYSDLPIPQTVPGEDQIKQDGTITLLQNQTFTAAGKSRTELEKEIRKRYVPDYFKSMTVTIKKKEQTQFYYVGGDVRVPNRQIYIGKMTLTKAIQSAGDFTDFGNKHKVILTRPDGRSATYDCKKILTNPAKYPDPEVFPGDKIFVPRRIL